jgi:hypothetical protein
MGMMGGGMGMMGGGMGMMGGMGMGGGMGGGQRATAPKVEPAAELREDQIQTAITFVGKPEVRTQKIRQVKAYLSQQMGLTNAELVEVMKRSGMEDPFAPVQDTDSEEEEEQPLPSRRALRGPSPLVEQPQQPSADLWGSVPAPLAYSAAAAALMVPDHKSWLERLTGTGTKTRARALLQQQLQQQLMDQARAGVGQSVSPVIVINQPPSALGLGRAGLSRTQWLFVVCCCMAVGFYGFRVAWRESVLPLLRRLLVRLGRPLGLQITECPPTPTLTDVQTAQAKTSMAELRAQLAEVRVGLKTQLDANVKRIEDRKQQLGANRQKAIKKKNKASPAPHSPIGTTKKKKAPIKSSTKKKKEPIKSSKKSKNGKNGKNGTSATKGASAITYHSIFDLVNSIFVE